MKPLIYKGLRKNLNRSEWVSSDEIKQSYSQIRLLAIENDIYTWIPIEDGTLCRGSEAKDTTGQRIYEKDHIEFDCKSVQDAPMVREVDFDLAFVVNNGNARVVGNRLEGYEHE